MDTRFFERPILNSPYAYPARHWELDPQGQPTGEIVEKRRTAQFITPIPRPRKHKQRAGQERLVFDEGAGGSTARQEYDPTPIINELRHRVDQWRAITNPSALPEVQGRHVPRPAHVPGARGHGVQQDHRPYNPVGSTAHVRFNTSSTHRWQTDAGRCHVNWVVLDSDWEAELRRVAESHPRVKACVKNHNLGLEVPYRYGSETRRYLPDFIVLVDDGHDDGHLLGARREPHGHARPVGVRRDDRPGRRDAA